MGRRLYNGYGWSSLMRLSFHIKIAIIFVVVMFKMSFQLRVKLKNYKSFMYLLGLIKLIFTLLLFTSK